MRVTGGDLRGRRLRAPEGRGTRPTSDLVRSALFSMLEARGVEPERVLDLYAGTGALGIEALSRGAAWCDFVERDAAAAGVIRDNLAALGLTPRARVARQDVRRFVEAQAGEPYDLVMADPPYADESVGGVLELLLGSPLVSDSTILAWEHPSRRATPQRLGSFDCIAERRHGDTVILLFANSNEG